MSKIKIDRNDSNRVLLTELLPYEVPMLFSNEGFYSIITNNKHQKFIDKIKEKKLRFGIPFSYEIAKSNDGDTRCLGIIHPINQLDFIEFYKDYDSIIIHLCAKSPFSLRKVTKVAKFCFSPELVFNEDEHKSCEVEVEPDDLYTETRILKSYFTYHPIDLIYKFYEKNDYQRLEQRFNLLWEFDVSKCFYHIYTHSITWAIKDKESAKINANKKTFENSFDEIMQKANYNETNGIIVGPEISRIFAEIILQQVDLNVLSKLNEIGLKNGLDYEIRRYVDDFFVFGNDGKVMDLILKTYTKELSFYKLYINSAKTEKRTTPFITNIAVGKRQVKKLVKELFESVIEIKKIQIPETKTIKRILPIEKPYSIAQYFIKDFQCIVRQNNITYDYVNKDVIRIFKNELVYLLKDNEVKKQQEDFENFLLMFLEISFYCYSLNINTSATFKIAQIIVLITKLLQGEKEDYKHTIYTKIFREAEFVMTNYHRKTKITETNIETINLLIALKKLGKGYLVSEKKIREYFNLEIEEGDGAEKELELFNKLNYFQIISLLYYFDDNLQYEKIRKLVEDSVVLKFKEIENPFHRAEFTCLFFDFICCPFVSYEAKRNLISFSKYSKGNFDTEIKEIESQKRWFMDWNPEIDLERVLKKKEWSSTY